jgi:hypothetical protein
MTSMMAVRRGRNAAIVVLVLLLGGCGSHGPTVLQVSAQHAPLQTPNTGEQFGSSWDARGSYDLALTGFNNTTQSAIRILRATTRTEGELVVGGIFLEPPGSVNRVQPGYGPSPLMYYGSSRPVVTAPVASVIPAHDWAQILVRVRLANGKQRGSIQSVTLTYLVNGQRYKTEYKMPFTLCRGTQPCR